MKVSRCCFRRVCVVAGLAGGLSIVALLGSAASASSSGDAPGRVQSAYGAAALASGGAWRTAEEVPGTTALNTGGDASTGPVSCAAAGNCAIAGSYTDAAGHGQAFVASQANGTWGLAQEVPGTAALNHFGAGKASSVSCGAVGNCAAGGYYTDTTGQQVFVVNQT